MFDKTFSFQYINNKMDKLGEKDVKLHLLTFRTSARRTIIVQVYEHEDEILVEGFEK
jgi:hypothetical protein